MRHGYAKYVSHAVAFKRNIDRPCDRLAAMQIGVVAHVKRDEMAYALAESVEADVFSLDEEEWFSLWESTRRCAENHMRVLSKLHALATPNEWCVVLEDDSVPIPAFRTEAAEAFKHAPSELVGLYLGQGNPSGQVQRNIRQALDHAEAWITADFFISAVGYAIKASLIPDVLDFIKPPRDEEFPLRLTRWAQDRDILTSYTHPSLVNHRDVESTIYPGVPLSERQKLPRVAWEWGTRTNWNTKSVYLEGDSQWGRRPT